MSKLMKKNNIQFKKLYRKTRELFAEIWIKC